MLVQTPQCRRGGGSKGGFSRPLPPPNLQHLDHDQFKGSDLGSIAENVLKLMCSLYLSF